MPPASISGGSVYGVPVTRNTVFGHQTTPAGDAMHAVFAAVLALQRLTLDLPAHEQQRVPHMMAQVDAYPLVFQKLSELAGLVLNDDFSEIAKAVEQNYEAAKEQALKALLAALPEPAAV